MSPKWTDQRREPIEVPAPMGDGSPAPADDPPRTDDLLHSSPDPFAAETVTTDRKRATPGSFIDDADSSRPPDRIGPYKILGELGRGGFGAVYHGRHFLGFDGAVKLLRRPWSADKHEFRNEAKRLAMLHGHPGVIAIRDFLLYTDPASKRRHPCFVTDLVPGSKSLTRYAEENRLTLDQRLTLMAQVCDAIDWVHARGVLHLDLKPQNILVDPRPPGPGFFAQPKVIDVGVAEAMDVARGMQQETRQSGLRGTYMYMSPEQTRFGSTKSPATDVYSLGVVLYELLTSRLPYDVKGLSAEQIIEAVRSAPPDLETPARAGVPSGVIAVLAKALAKDPAHRYGTAADLAADLRRYLREGLTGAQAPSALTLASNVLARRLSRDPLLRAGLAAVLGLLLGGLIVPFVFANTSINRRFESAALAWTAPAKLSRVAVISAPLSIVPRPADPAAPPQPWRRREVLASILDALSRASECPTAVAFDFQFRELRPPDELFAAAIKRLMPRAPVVLGLPEWRFGPDGLPPPGILSPVLAATGAPLGHLRMNNPVHTDGSVWVWSIPLINERADSEPALALAAVAAAHSIFPRTQIEAAIDDTEYYAILRPFDTGRGGTRQYLDQPRLFRVSGVSALEEPPPAPRSRPLVSASLLLPIPSDQALAAITIPAQDVIDQKPEAIAMLRGRIAVIGDVEDAADSVPTPDGRRVAGVYSHAVAIDQLLSSAIRRPDAFGHWTISLAGAALGVLIPASLYRRSPSARRRVFAAGALAWFAVLVVITLVAVYAGLSQRYLINPAVPLVTLATATLVWLAMLFFATRHPIPKGVVP